MPSMRVSWPSSSLISPAFLTKAGVGCVHSPTMLCCRPTIEPKRYVLIRLRKREDQHGFGFGTSEWLSLVHVSISWDPVCQHLYGYSMQCSTGIPVVAGYCSKEAALVPVQRTAKYQYQVLAGFCVRSERVYRYSTQSCSIVPVFE